jgi:hypothetical protein
MLSSPELQTSYFTWMTRFVAVRWLPCVVLLMQLSIHCALAFKREEFGCRWRHQFIGSPCTVLMAVRVVLAAKHADEVVQSMVSFAGTFILATLWCVMIVANDRCFITIGASSTRPTLLDAGFSAILHTASGFVMTPVHMDFVPALSALLFFTRGSAVYLQFLLLRDGVTWSSDPNLWGLLVVLVTTALSCLAAVAMRYEVTKTNLKLFLYAVTHRTL